MLRKQDGFSLIELLIVLGIIGAMASVILPNLSLTPGSQMSIALRDFTTSMRNTYDSAVLRGRVTRLVIHVKKGTYWAEEAPLGYEGRPPVAIEEDAGAKADARAKLLEDLNQAASEPRKTADGKREYIQRSILVLKRNTLVPIKWSKIEDAVLSERSLPGAVAFVSAFTQGMRDKLQFSAATEKDTAFIYFFPSGASTQAAIQLGVLKSENEIDENGPKYTVVLEPLTGHSELLEGFHDIDFKTEL